MPEEDLDNTEVDDPYKGTKFEGKSPAQIAEMYSNLETRLGAQGEELGVLRQAVQRPVVQEPQRREAARVSDYSRFAEDIIVEPERVLPEFGDEIERRATAKATQAVAQQMALQQRTEAFFRANPGLDEHRDIVSVIGTRVYQMNPNAPYDQVLEITKREATQYITQLGERFGSKKKTEADRKRNAITTGGGSAREQVPDDDASQSAGPVLSSEQQAVMNEVKRIKDSRAKRVLPPRSR